MKKRITLVLATCAAATLLAACATPAWWPSSGPSFFVTSSNPGRGGDFGGLAGADRHCQALGAATGAVNKTWRAYLST
ncbi:MAG TPA: hypothetical protein VIL30_00310, partial [Ramlibacter sp.]